MTRSDNLGQAHHGALDYHELESLGINPSSVIDFSSNINPYGPIQPVIDAATSADIKSYPDRDALALRQAIAATYEREPAEIIAGNGASELIWLLCLALLQPGDSVLVVAPTFSEYGRCAQLAGAQVSELFGGHDLDYAVPMEQIRIEIRNTNPRLVFLCNPNNPTGHLYPVDEILDTVSSFPETLFVIDEAYIDFVPQAKSLIKHQAANLIVLRSMTKYYALAGLRLGYLVASPEIIHNLEDIRPAWNVNAVAQAAGIAALQNKTLVDSDLPKLIDNNKQFVNQLVSAGYSPLPSSTQYFLLQVGNAAEIRQQLLRQHQIQVRDCASFGLPQHIRISTRLPHENDLLLEALVKLQLQNLKGNENAR